MKKLTRFVIFSLVALPLLLRGQNRAKPALEGHFLTDSLEIGRPFQYALTYRHAAFQDVLFPDTARHFAPYMVQKVAVFPTQTTGTGSKAISRDSAVYTLLSFETDSVQFLRVPLRVIHEADCTEHWTGVDTVFLRSSLRATVSDPAQRRALALFTETGLAPLQQEFNYLSLVVWVTVLCAIVLLLYILFGWSINRQWQRYLLNRRHRRFVNEFSRLLRQLDTHTAAEVANQAVILWKSYLEQLDKKPYTSLTTSELAERLHDKRIDDALRDVDRLIYGRAFSPASSLPSLQILRDVATRMYHQHINGTEPAIPAAPSSIA